MPDIFLANPLFGIVLTLSAYAAGVKLYQKVNISIFHPVLTASALIIALMMIFNIKLDYYQSGGSIISFMLGPATVTLAVPLYKQLNELKKYGLVIIASISVGTIISIISVITLSKILGIPKELILSLVPKSITTPIAVEISDKIGGLPSITAFAVIFTGIFGAVAGPLILKILKIRQPAAVGLAMGTSAHAIGTSRALEIGETEGAVSSLSIGLAGIITVIAAPLLIHLM